MQQIIFYVDAHETLGSVRDYANAKSAAAPTLVRGVEACLKIRLFASESGTEPYPVSAFGEVVSWTWAMDSDFDEATNYKLVGDNGGIKVRSVAGTVDGEETVYTEISIPMPDMNTEELAEWLGTEKSKTGLTGELVGFDAAARQVYILQIENFTVRNRITSLGDPAEIAPEYLTGAQVRALFAAGMECQFSSDGEDWHDVQTAGDDRVRMRLRGEEAGRWSDPVTLLAGPSGTAGRDSFCYVAYASDAEGNGFSTEPDSSLKYRAEIHTGREIETPGKGDFAGAKWIKYCGDDGTGVGDMMKRVYDPDDTGTVLSAGTAAYAGSVAWAGVTGKPEKYAPDAHAHTMANIEDPVSQTVFSASNPATLFLDHPVVRNTARNDTGNISLDFTLIRISPDGIDCRPSETHLWTWEYHVLCGAPVTGVSVGSENCTMAGINIPEKLELVNGNPTWHVFAIRALYRSGACNSTGFQANYAYSYEA